MRVGDYRVTWYDYIVYGSEILNNMTTSTMRLEYQKDCCVTRTGSWDYETLLEVYLGSGMNLSRASGLRGHCLR